MLPFYIRRFSVILSRTKLQSHGSNNLQAIASLHVGTRQKGEAAQLPFSCEQASLRAGTSEGLLQILEHPNPEKAFTAPRCAAPPSPLGTGTGSPPPVRHQTTRIGSGSHLREGLRHFMAAHTPIPPHWRDNFHYKVNKCSDRSPAALATRPFVRSGSAETQKQRNHGDSDARLGPGLACRPSSPHAGRSRGLEHRGFGVPISPNLWGSHPGAGRQHALAVRTTPVSSL